VLRQPFAANFAAIGAALLFLFPTILKLLPDPFPFGAFGLKDVERAYGSQVEQGALGKRYPQHSCEVIGAVPLALGGNCRCKLTIAHSALEPGEAPVRERGMPIAIQRLQVVRQHLQINARVIRCR
jgi:hypothetical protein